MCDQLRATGEWNPNWDPFYELDPAWTEGFMAMGLKPMLDGVLDPRPSSSSPSRSMRPAPTCTRRACAATSARRSTSARPRQEITAVLQLTSVLGIHTMSLGAPILLEELAARRARRAARAA